MQTATATAQCSGTIEPPLELEPTLRLEAEHVEDLARHRAARAFEEETVGEKQARSHRSETAAGEHSFVGAFELEAATNIFLRHETQPLTRELGTEMQAQI